jgi:ribonuclease T1
MIRLRLLPLVAASLLLGACSGQTAARTTTVQPTVTQTALACTGAQTVGCTRSRPPSGSARTAAVQTQPAQSAQPAQSGRDPASGLAWVALSGLPREARTTYRLILAGGPYPYSRDGVVYQNREGVLPRRSRGSYHEYTVRTPGSSDRGARRLVCAAVPECYYTDDHYASFRRVAGAQ